MPLLEIIKDSRHSLSALKITSLFSLNITFKIINSLYYIPENQSRYLLYIYEAHLILSLDVFKRLLNDLYDLKELI